MTLALVPASAVDDAPTNPMFTNTAFSDNDRIYTAIVPNGDISFSVAHFAGSVTEYSNLFNTKGFRIKCYDALTGDGVQFNPTDFETYDYFVLVYSDDDYKHHFARIKEVINEDEEGDAFEFEPKLGNEIPKNTKFMIFKGPSKATNVVALSAGILQDSANADLEANLICARPLFYFYEGLDKDGELDHDTKYYVMQNGGSGASYTLDKTVSSPKDNHTFRTVQDFGQTIVDYGKHSLRITLTDKLRGLDGRSYVGPTPTNEGNSVALAYEDYDAAFPNARRDANDELTTLSYTGPKRYLHYGYSPLRANFTYGVYSHKTYDSVSGRGGFSETKIVDTARILQKKITEFTDYKVRHIIHRATLDDWFALEATFSSDAGSHVFTFDTDFDLDDFINVGDELKIDDRIYIVQTIGLWGSFSQTITMRNKSRLENEVILSSGYYTPSSGAIVYRRGYNFTDKTLMVNFDLIDNRYSKLSVSFISLNMEELFATVSAVDATKKMITLAFAEDSYYGDPLRYTEGEFLVHVERFNGEIEEISSKKENGQTVFEVKGRDKFNKLISPIVNLNTLFSEDIVYSSNSPYNKLATIKSGASIDIAFGSTSKDTGEASLTIYPKQGDKLFTINGYIGEMTSDAFESGGTWRLAFTSALTEANSEEIYVDTEKNYIFTKALGSSHLATNSPTSLTGSANKGVFFTGGSQINPSTGVEANTLIGTSGHENPKAIGYSINSPSSISSDRAFQAKLHDEFGSSNPSSFDTVNTLIDFEVVSTTKKDNVTELELAPYLPIALGRAIPNYGNLDDYSLVEVALIEETTPVLNDSNPNIIEASSDGIKALSRGDPVFIGNAPNFEFAGLVRTMRLKRGTADKSNLLYLDRDFNCDAGQKIYRLVKKDTHDLFFVNGSHLWGGKMLSIPHPTLTSTGPVPLNMENDYLANGDISEKYGRFYYKTNALSKGNFNYLRRHPTLSGSLRETYANQSKIKYSTINYRFAPNYLGNTPLAFDKTGTADDIHMDITRRGYGSAYGSLFSGQARVRRNVSSADKFPDEFSSSVFVLDNFIASLAQKDSTTATLFLYITSDLLPYSSLRTDSLLNGNKTLTNYNLFLMENKEVKDSVRNFTETTGGNQILLNDNSFQTLAINQNIDLSTLKRFGMMRLTELCLDIHFNPFNPEEKTVANDSYFNFEEFNGKTFTEIGTIDVSASIGADTDKIVLTGTPTNLPAVGNILHDVNYKLIGTVSAYNPVTFTITLNDDAYLNDDGTFTSGLIYRQSTNTIIALKGAKDKHTFMSENRAHIQKGAIITEDYQGDVNDAWHHNNDDLTLSMPTYTVAVAPIRFEYPSASAQLSSTFRSMPSRPFYQYFASSGNVFKGCALVVLDTFNIEDGNLYEIEKGVTTELTHDRIVDFDNTVTSTYTDMLCFRNTNNRNFSKKYPQTQDSSDNNATAPTSAPYPAKGANIALKPRFHYASGAHSSSTISSSSGTLFVYDLNVFSARLAWIDMVDMTGFYLVSEDGKDTTIQNAVSSSVSQTSVRTMEGVIPDEIIYVISHTVTNSGARNHKIVLDKPLTDLTNYRVLKPNQTAFYDYSPKQITLNMLSSHYTKMANENKMYDVKQDLDIIEGTQGKDSFGGIGARREAFLSMYVAVDLDKQSSSENSLVIRTAENFLDILPVGNYNLFASDGDSNVKTEINIQSNYDFIGEQEVIMTLSKIKELDGIVSFSETFTLQCFEEFKIQPRRACIGATATVCLEAEDLINELFEQNNIDFSISENTDYPYYLAPNFKGVDLYSAIRYIMEKKDFVLLEENGTFSITQGNDSSHYSNVVLNESSKFKIFEFEKATTLFDFYNEIIVYGNTHKAERKDLRSVQKRGRKTLEHHDKTLVTQEEVSKKAVELLRLHSTFNQKLIMTVGHEGLSQLRAGDIINVEIKQENIEMGQYMVLQIEHELTGLMRLELGRYSKELSDLFSELLVTQKQINSNLRNEKFNEKSVSYNFLDTLNIKELRLLIRKRQSTGGFNLGFGETLNTGNNPLGFNGGTITITELYEEDLA